MDLELDLVKSCKDGVFPKIKTMSKFGINNTNPIDVLNCYITSITEDGLDEKDFKKYNNKINSLFEEKTFFLKQKDFYKRVINSGGIVISNDDIIECDTCYYNGVNSCKCDIKI